MPQSLANIPVHLVFSTKHREALISADIRDELYAYITGILRNYDCQLFQIGGVEDHVHILFQLSRKYAVSFIVEKVKSGSNGFVNTKFKGRPYFSWQGGYGSFGAGPEKVKSLIKYIQNQKEHHKTVSFKEEFLELLREHGLEGDERYLWD